MQPEIYKVMVGKTEVPLATTPLGKEMARGTSAGVAYTIELLRYLRDNAAEVVTGADFSPHLLGLSENGWAVSAIVPLTQLKPWPGVNERINVAVERFISSGELVELNPMRRMPPGRGSEDGIRMSVVRRGATVFGREITGMKFRRDLMNFLEGGTPVAAVTWKTDAMDIARLEGEHLHRGGGEIGTDSAPELPVVHMKIDLAWLDASNRGKCLLTKTMSFPFGSFPIKFDESGQVEDGLFYTVEHGKKKVFYHPSLLGWGDTVAFISEIIKRKTGGVATVTPDMLTLATAKARMAGGHMEEVLAPHLVKMNAIEMMGRRLATDPGTVADAIGKLICFFDRETGEIVPESTIMDQLSPMLTGGEGGNGNLVTTWVQLVYELDRFCREKGFLAAWGGDKGVLEGILEKAGGAHELQALSLHWVGSQVDPRQYGVRPVPITTLLSEGSAPVSLHLTAQALIARRQVFSTMVVHRARRELAGADAVVRMAQEFTMAVERYWENEAKAFGEAVSSMPDAGTEMGRKVGEAARKNYTGPSVQAKLGKILGESGPEGVGKMGKADVRERTATTRRARAKRDRIIDELDTEGQGGVVDGSEG